METEGVVQYQLLGAHPAASMRYHNFGFSGDTVSVEAMLGELVRQHQISLAKYKLEVRLLADRADAAGDALQPSSALRSYDRVVVTVSRRQYADGVAAAAQDEARARAEALRSVEGLLRGHDDAQCEAPAPVADPHAFSRVAALSGKAFPLLPARPRTASTCVLCDLPPFDETALPCCGIVVCCGCLALARTMAADEEACPVCGVVAGAVSLSHHAGAAHRRESLKREGVESSDVEPSGGVGVVRPLRSTQELAARASSHAAVFQGELTANMAQLLSQLDVPDPLSTETKIQRRPSKILAQCTDR